MSSKFWTYAVGSGVLTAAVITNAFREYEQFYPAMVHLSKSKPCLMVMGNLALVLTILFGHGIKRLFIGQLREIEIEHLTDRIWGTVMDTLLAMTIFRNEFNVSFVVFFTVLLFLKIFHWVVQDRVEYMQHTPVSGTTSTRIFGLMVLLMAADAGLLYHAGYISWTKGPSMMLLFGFEFLLLLSTVVSTTIKFTINLIDSRRETAWEGKGGLLLYLEFATDIFQLVVYLLFFAIIMNYYGLPLHIVRNVYLTFRSMRQCIESVVRYRRATANMNERFPDVSAAELAGSEQICIVCREELTQGKRLPCGHILHFQCLLGWLQRQQNCPICRTSVFAPARHPNAPATPEAHQQPQQHQHQHQHQQQALQHQPPRAAARILHQQHKQQQASQSPSAAPGDSSYEEDVSYEMTPTHDYNRESELEQQVQILQAQVMSLQEEVTRVMNILDQHGLLSSPSSSSSSSSSASDDKDSNSPADPLDELRKRRLLRFSQS